MIRLLHDNGQTQLLDSSLLGDIHSCTSIHITEAEVFLHDALSKRIYSLPRLHHSICPFGPSLRTLTVSLIATGPCMVAFSTGSALYSIGLNMFNPSIDSESPQLELLAEWAVTSVCVGYKHIVVIAEMKAYAVGCNEYGQLGIGCSEKVMFSRSPLPVALPEGVTPVAVSAGSYHNALVTSTGEVYTWGLGSYHRLGYTIEGNIAPAPTLLEDLLGVGDLTGGIPRGITLIACGTWHTIAATRSSSGASDVYGWGWCKFGQCGHAAEVMLTSPTLLDVEADVLSLCAGATYTALQTANSIMML